LPWFSPDPRAVLEPDAIRMSRSLRQRLRTCGWETTVDVDFEGVVAACADRPDSVGTWITPQMQAAYVRLHRLGWAHSLEVWAGPNLVGGVYGVAVGACFTGESMFHRASDASKVALVDFLDRWRQGGGRLFDAQLPTPHLTSLGFVEIARSEFLRRLAELREQHVAIPLGRRAVLTLPD
jgi:leucyl/phenylalanyl-tRNA--protein transferase